MSTREAPIRARTKSERDAYMAGYAAGALDVHERGLDFAQQQIRLHLETDPPAKRPSVASD